MELVTKQEFESMKLRVERIEQHLGLSTGIQLIRCAKCGQIKHQPMTMGCFPEGICGDCIKKEREAAGRP